MAKQLKLSPTFPLEVQSNHAGFSPGFTYWYIVDARGYTFHFSDKKWRLKQLKEMQTYYFKSMDAAMKQLDTLNSPLNIWGRPKQTA